MGEFANEEKAVLYDVIQAVTLAHDLYVGNNVDVAKINERLSKEDIFDGGNLFAYWFHTMLFTVLAWRIGFEQTTKIGYGALFGAMNQSLNGEMENWASLALGLSQTREMAEAVTDFLFGFKGAAGDESENGN